MGGEGTHEDKICLRIPPPHVPLPSRLMGIMCTLMCKFFKGRVHQRLRARGGLKGGFKSGCSSDYWRLESRWGGSGGRTEAVGAELTVIPKMGRGLQHPLQVQA